MLKTKIKAGQLTNLTDARYFAAWEVEWLGFNLNLGDDTYIAPEQVKAMKEWVEGPKIVGEFGLQDPQTVLEYAKALELDGVQVGSFYDTQALKRLKGYAVLKELIIDKNALVNDIEATLAQNAPYVDTYILEFSKNGISFQDIKNNIPFSLEALKNICRKFPCLLSIEATTAETEELLASTSCQGLHVVGGEEEKVGLKLFDDLDELFELLIIEE